MFFSTYVLTKKGPLAKVWLAAHWDRRLTRHEVKVVDLRQTIVHIVQPVVPIALRTSGELLVGVVRIYALKMKHLLKEATDATLLLRVTTILPGKGHSASAAPGTEDPVAAVHAAGKKTLLDGVLIHGATGDVEAVTFDWSADATAGIAGVGPRDAADALCEARFDDIADLLRGRPALTSADALAGGRGSEADAMLASAWYALEPAMQSTDEIHGTQKDYDEIARLRADLMAGGEDGRDASGSGSGSKKSLSNPSIEKGRHSAQHMFLLQQQQHNQALIGDFPAPALADEFDIGAPLPEDHELPAFLLPNSRDDLFAVPDAAFAAPVPPGPNSATKGRRNARSMSGIVVDTAATTLPRETFERWMAERGDTIDTEPRRGPFDAQEARDRTCLAPDPPAHTSVPGGSASSTTRAAATTTGGQSEGHAQLLWNIVDSHPMLWQMSETLGAAYAAAMAPSLEEALAAHRRPSRPEPEALREQAYLDEEALAGMGGEALDLAENSHLSRKRPREDDAHEVDEANRADPSGSGLSLGAIATLRRIRDTIARGAEASRKPKGRHVAKPAEVCALHEVCRHMHRREAARAFVDVLALASKQMLSARQERVAGDVELALAEAAEAVLAQ